MVANKTQETDADVIAFVAQLVDPVQRTDTDVLIALMSRVSGHPPKMWGPSIIGFGSYHYTYDSGREGDMCRIGFSPRKGQFALYGLGSQLESEAAQARLGKHITGKGCLYFKKLANVNEAALEEIASAGWAEMARRYPD